MTFQKFTGREYIMIDVANNYGLDKETWDYRLDWFRKHESELEDLVPTSKEPALFFAGVKAWRDVNQGKPTGYMISLDATSSGLQLLAALTSDPYAAKLCNVVNTGKREDAYQGIFAHMKSLTGSNVKLDKDDVKQAVMTAFYSSKAVPKMVFGEGALLDVFYGTLKDLAPGAWELNEAMLALWNPNALEHSWVLPDNFHVHIKVMDSVREKVHFLGEPHDVFYKVNQPMEEGRSLGANTIHSIDGMIVRELTRRCDFDSTRIEYLRQILVDGDFGSSQLTEDDLMVVTLWSRYQETGYLSARILDYLNEDNMGLVESSVIQELLDSMPYRPFKVVSIHDCFRCHPNYGDDLRWQYNLQLQLIAKSKLLENIISQLAGRPITINKMEPKLWMQIAHTNYALS